MNTAQIVEIFDSLQGEGKFAGARQVFVRLSGCPLKCCYCDTDHAPRKQFELNGAYFDNPVTAKSLASALLDAYPLKLYHSVSFTGGEPLLYKQFLKDISLILRKEGVKLFLETSGYDPSATLDIADYFDYISVDLKSTITPFDKHADELISAAGLICADKLYIKLPLGIDSDDVVMTVSAMCKRYAVGEIWLQPLDNVFDMDVVRRWQLEFAGCGVEARFIPQIHKLIDIR